MHPDASVLDVVASAVLTLIVLATAGVGESAIILRLAGNVRIHGNCWRGGLLLLAGVAIWFLWGALLDHLHGNDVLRAGYLNSRLPHSLRYFFTFERLILWLGWAWTALGWIGAGIIAVFVFTATASSAPLRTMWLTLRSLTYWTSLALGVFIATFVSGSLLQWTPGHSLRAEMLSLVLRLGLATLIDAAVACFLLAILAAYVRRTNALYAASGGTPDQSQPRTVDNP